MAGLIEAASQTGLTLYAIVRNASGQVWNGSAFQAYNSANWATYALAMSEQSGSGYYSVAFPAAITTAGKYTLLIYQQQGGSPALSDATTPGVVGEATIEWTGSQAFQGLFGDAISELSGLPSATPSPATALMLLFMALRNQRTATGTLEKIFNDAGTCIVKATLSDDTVTTTRAKLVTGP